MVDTITASTGWLIIRTNGDIYASSSPKFNAQTFTSVAAISSAETMCRICNRTG
jgi:hypothetical protein